MIYLLFYFPKLIVEENIRIVIIRFIELFCKKKKTLELLDKTFTILVIGDRKLSSFSNEFIILFKFL